MNNFLSNGITLAIFISFGTIPQLIEWLNLIHKGGLIEKIFFFMNSLLRLSMPTADFTF